MCVNFALVYHLKSIFFNQKLINNHNLKFILRAKVLSLYRMILRSSSCISKVEQRREVTKYVRNEFERNREVSDLMRIRYLVSTGKAEWERALNLI
ncbi:hypothetical protein HI914_04707 [Erysiphe necator]|nr:hypothetical protein HI914_04707 [Erysiphe necator]